MLRNGQQENTKRIKTISDKKSRVGMGKRVSKI